MVVCASFSRAENRVISRWNRWVQSGDADLQCGYRVNRLIEEIVVQIFPPETTV